MSVASKRYESKRRERARRPRAMLRTAFFYHQRCGRLTNAIIVAAMRCCPRSFYYLLAVYAIEAGMQDRVKLQAGGEAE